MVRQGGLIWCGADVGEHRGHKQKTPQVRGFKKHSVG